MDGVAQVIARILEITSRVLKAVFWVAVLGFALTAFGVTVAFIIYIGSKALISLPLP